MKAEIDLEILANEIRKELGQEEKKIKYDDYEKRLKEADDFFYKILKPQVFWGKDGVEVQYWKDYERTCNVMMQEGCPDPDSLTVRRYLQFLEDLKSKYKQQTKKGAKRGR